MERGLIARFSVAAVALLVFGLAGCASKPPEEPAPQTGSEWQEAPVGEPAERDPEPTDVRSLTEVDLATVYFDFDRFDIRPDARPSLRTNADAINDVPESITIQGYCDERGSEEYNLALGERRASSVKRYLVDLGIPSARLRTVSFGEANPAVLGHDESAWRYNRRAEFIAN
jgi:peptidoglycan-associated lipoprotein